MLFIDAKRINVERLIAHEHDDDIDRQNQQTAQKES